MSDDPPKSLIKYRLKLIALITVFLAPFIGGWFALYVFEMKPTSGNYGELIQPVKKIIWPVLDDLDGNKINAGFGRKWAFIMFSEGDCDEQCQSNLFYMRQIRILLGRDTKRLQNIIISSGAVSEDFKLVLKDFPQFIVIENSQNVAFMDIFNQLSEETLGRSAKMFLVDPDNNLMMHYPAKSDHYRMLDDVKKLMKLSQIG